jgi:hypothetical protein
MSDLDPLEEAQTSERGLGESVQEDPSLLDQVGRNLLGSVVVRAFGEVVVIGGRRILVGKQVEGEILGAGGMLKRRSVTD